MASNKEMRAIAREAASLGFDVTRTKNGHYKIRAKNGEWALISFSPGTAWAERQTKRTWNKFKEEHPDG